MKCNHIRLINNTDGIKCDRCGRAWKWVGCYDGEAVYESTKSLEFNQKIANDIEAWMVHYYNYSSQDKTAKGYTDFKYLKDIVKKLRTVKR